MAGRALGTIERKMVKNVSNLGQHIKVASVRIKIVRFINKADPENLTHIFSLTLTLNNDILRIENLPSFPLLKRGILQKQNINKM